MMGVEFTMSPGLKKRLNMDTDSFISHTLDMMMDELINVMSRPGYCPVRTGALRDHHYVRKLSATEMALLNTMFYWAMVVYGTKLTSPNDYPTRARRDLFNSNQLEIVVHTAFMKAGG